MKLYEVPRNTFVKVMEDNVHVPPGMEPIKRGDVVYFDHIDGMYSYCMDKEQKNVMHLAAFTEVEIVTTV